MIGIIERIKNNVLLKCNTLNDGFINETLRKTIDKAIYHYAEELYSLLGDIYDSETKIRNEVERIVKIPIIKKLKRKLFIDSLAIQVTNDSYIEKYFNEKINIINLRKEYIKELVNNKNTNQLNMTEDLKLDEVKDNLDKYTNQNIIVLIKENEYLAKSVLKLNTNLVIELELQLEKMIDNLDNEYLNVLVTELKKENNKGKGEEIMMEELEVVEPVKSDISKFDKYDDMTLFNKMILCLNTKEENLSRKEAKLEKRKEELENVLNATNKNIESNVERESILTKKMVELNKKEVELNSKLSETEVIFLNIKPLINGLNKIKVSNEGGANND